jgi:hypothetical protein
MTSTITATRTAEQSRTTGRSIVPAPFAELDSFATASQLDLVLADLARDHQRHATGPVFPCPRCFKPPLSVAL